VLGIAGARFKVSSLAGIHNTEAGSRKLCSRSQWLSYSHSKETATEHYTPRLIATRDALLA
jgi:hypothetical protein